ncbi:tyrosine-protein phosphatase 69D isoform X2 [Drosophila willistoni]|uniref:tyrosine-protein phosphatase 69D isoform X2 n=1 Tax=Drosophila willistoni TaxID=7260 RepID=UPI000C26C65E|nr:tyrosine-protein phosphatase 69D isoform X2 [Drosophila willistoni]
MALYCKRFAVLTNVVLSTICVLGHSEQDWTEIGNDLSLRCTSEMTTALWNFNNRSIETNTRS